MTDTGLEPPRSKAHGSPDESIPAPDEIARSLSKGAAWGVRDDEVEWIQTHISHVFIVGDRVYKLRKAIRLDFLDFGSRAARNRDCLDEVALNRRLAHDVYLGIAPIESGADGARVGSIRDALSQPDQEHVVVMRKLPKDRDALSLLEAGRLGPAQLETVACELARFHASHALGLPAPWSAAEWFERNARPVRGCVEALAESRLIDSPRIAALKTSVDRALESQRGRLEERRRAGRAVDAHGDLHLDHVWFESDDAAPVLIDCIEFNEDLRHIDVASEVGFLAMDLCYRGRDDLAQWFLSAYAMQTDDYDLFSVVDFFASYRALVRAKVAALAASQSTISKAQRTKSRDSAERHISLAENFLDAKSSPGIVLLCGTVGSGKSSVARYLAQSGLGVPIVSDRTRKVLAGLAPTAHPRLGADEGIYRPETTDAVYRALLERAALVTKSGRTAILDASFTSRAQRDRARDWATARGLPAKLIEVRCDEETARARLEKRERVGADASDAGPGFLSTSLARFEAPDEWPSADRVIVHTDTEH